MMNGTIDVLSEENKGTEFIVRLQFRLADPSAANSSSEKTGTSCASSVSSIEEVENFNNTELSSHNELHFAGRQIRLLKEHGGDTVPVIALSANAFEEDKKASFEAGMNGHLAKPINVIELLETLSLILCD